MKLMDWFWAVVEFGIWYAFVYYLLYTIKNPVILPFNALVLLVLLYLGIAACPLVRKTEAWKRLWSEK